MTLFFRSILSFLKDEEYRSLLFSAMVILGIGTLTYHFLEGWSWIDSLYFSVITLTTIGYGDFSPQTDSGKLFTIFYILLGLGMILTFIQTVWTHYSAVVKDKKNRGKWNLALLNPYFYCIKYVTIPMMDETFLKPEWIWKSQLSVQKPHFHYWFFIFWYSYSECLINNFVSSDTITNNKSVWFSHSFIFSTIAIFTLIVDILLDFFT